MVSRIESFASRCCFGSLIFARMIKAFFKSCTACNITATHSSLYAVVESVFSAINVFSPFKFEVVFVEFLLCFVSYLAYPFSCEFHSCRKTL